MKLLALIGPNFSGRTSALRVAGPGGRLPAYIGPEISNYLSGLSLSVREEIDIGQGSCPMISEIIDWFGLKNILAKNPFEISGGEQALVTIASNWIDEPDRFSIDCVFEQLGIDRRRRVIEFLFKTAKPHQEILFVDNRFDEYADLIPSVDTKTMNQIASNRPQIGKSDITPLRISPHTLTVTNLSFAYKRSAPVLRDISFDFLPGQIYILRGENGAGKSTLAKIMSGLLKPLAGDVSVKGSIVRPWREPGSIASYHFQNPDLQLLATSVNRELMLGVRRFKLGEHGFRNARHLLHFFGLDYFENEHPLDLPFVLRKRAALAATFSTGRPWVILDEPTLGQDEETCRALAKFLIGATEEGLGIIIITHSDSFASKLTGQTVILKDGVLQMRNKGGLCNGGARRACVPSS